MNTQTTQEQINCQTTDEHSHPTPVSTYTPSASTTLINPSVDTQSTNQPIQGVSGAQYAPLNTSPQTPEQQQNARVTMLMEMLTTTLNQLVKELQTPTQPQTDLEQAVDTALEQAQWFKDFVEETCAERVGDLDFEYEIGRAVELEMRNFDPNDHVDFDDLVRDAVDDRLDEIVEEKLEALLEEKLKHANITISF